MQMLCHHCSSRLKRPRCQTQLHPALPETAVMARRRKLVGCGTQDSCCGLHCARRLAREALGVAGPLSVCTTIVSVAVTSVFPLALTLLLVLPPGDPQLDPICQDSGSRCWMSHRLCPPLPQHPCWRWLLAAATLDPGLCTAGSTWYIHRLAVHSRLRRQCTSWLNSVSL
jgi:hypothetical protein